MHQFYQFTCVGQMKYFIVIAYAVTSQQNAFDEGK